MHTEWKGETKVEYEYVPGESVSPDWKGRSVPIPPRWVREKVVLPRKLAPATLARDVEDGYLDSVLPLARTYVSSFPHYRAYGMGPVIVGRSGAGKTWTAAALLNEITLRYAGVYDLSTAWISTFYSIPQLLDARSTGESEKYFFLRNRFHQADLVVVDNLLAAAKVEGGKQAIWSLYDYRDQHQLPTITTIDVTYSDQAKVWDRIEKSFGRYLVHKLRSNSEGLVAWV